MRIRTFFVASALLIMVTGPAHAYLDPGTASIILQAIVGGVAAGGLFFRKYIYMTVGFFRRKPAKPTPAGTTSDERASPAADDT